MINAGFDETISPTLHPDFPRGLLLKKAAQPVLWNVSQLGRQLQVPQGTTEQFQGISFLSRRGVVPHRISWLRKAFPQRLKGMLHIALSPSLIGCIALASVIS